MNAPSDETLVQHHHRVFRDLIFGLPEIDPEEPLPGVIQWLSLILSDGHNRAYRRLAPVFGTGEGPVSVADQRLIKSIVANEILPNVNEADRPDVVRNLRLVGWQF